MIKATEPMRCGILYVRDDDTALRRVFINLGYPIPGSNLKMMHCPVNRDILTAPYSVIFDFNQHYFRSLKFNLG